MSVFMTRFSAVPVVLIATLLMPATVRSQEDLNAQTATAFRSRSFKEASRLATDAWEAYKTGTDKRQAGIAAANLGAVDAV
jgi:hypothetical protein